MGSNIKPIVLWSHVQGPNPWKVAVILEELGLPYETKFMDFPDMKKDPYETLNPNGRVPAIEDPNTGINLFESGAIIEYLIETYDKSNSLTYTSSPEKYLTKAWLHFQMSGQGPYYGQRAWFKHFHSEKNITSAIERYGNEIKRILGVLDRHLKKHGTGWLVGDKCTYADLSFVTWDIMLPFLMGDELNTEKDFPNYHAWNQKMMQRPAVKKVAEDKQKALASKDS